MQFTFDASQYAPLTSNEPIPDGWYKAVIEKSETNQTKDGKGGYLMLQFRVIDGEHKDRFIIMNLNVYNQSQKAVEIAYRNLSTICHCIGVFQVQDTQQLHNIPLQIKVITTQDPGYAPRNEVRGFKDIQGNEPARNGGNGHAPAPTSQPYTPSPAAMQHAASIPAAPPASAPAWNGTPAPTPAPAGNPAWNGVPGVQQGVPVPTPAPQQGFAPPPTPAWVQK